VRKKDDSSVVAPALGLRNSLATSAGPRTWASAVRTDARCSSRQAPALCDQDAYEGRQRGKV